MGVVSQSSGSKSCAGLGVRCPRRNLVAEQDAQVSVRRVARALANAYSEERDTHQDSQQMR